MLDEAMLVQLEIHERGYPTVRKVVEIPTSSSVLELCGEASKKFPDGFRPKSVQLALNGRRILKEHLAGEVPPLGGITFVIVEIEGGNDALPRSKEWVEKVRIV